MNTTEIVKKSVGRPPANISWPDGTFTVEELKSKLSISKVTLYLKVAEALKNGSIVSVGKIPSKQGRPRTLLAKASTTVGAVDTTTIVSNAVAPTSEPAVEVAFTSPTSPTSTVEASLVNDGGAGEVVLGVVDGQVVTGPAEATV